METSGKRRLKQEMSTLGGTGNDNPLTVFAVVALAAASCSSPPLEMRDSRQLIARTYLTA